MIATSQQAGRPEAYPTRTLPPSERDFEIYQMVVGEGQSTRAAAREVGLSQTRIIQICDRVAEWIGSEVPPTAKLTPAQRLVVAVDIAERRFDFLYSESMEGWRERKGQPGDVRYLSQAMRIAERRIVVSQREAEARQAIEKASAKAQEPGDRNQGSGAGNQGAVAAESPPVGACSAEAASESMQHKADPVAVDANDCQPKTSDEADWRRTEFLADLESVTTPVQPLITDASGTQLDEPETELDHVDEPEAELDHLQFDPRLAAEGERLSGGAAMPSRPLNRQERRARQRMLERARKRK